VANAELGVLVRIDRERSERTAGLSRHHALSAYDAAYVAAAEHIAAPLASCHERDLVSSGLAKLPHEGARQRATIRFGVVPDGLGARSSRATRAEPGFRFGSRVMPTAHSGLEVPSPGKWSWTTNPAEMNRSEPISGPPSALRAVPNLLDLQAKREQYVAMCSCFTRERSQVRNPPRP
jgi:hypothetical protein